MKLPRLLPAAALSLAFTCSAQEKPFAIEVIATLDREDPQYVVDVVSIVESVLDDPRRTLVGRRPPAATRAARGRRRGRAGRRHGLAGMVAEAPASRTSSPS